MMRSPITTDHEPAPLTLAHACALVAAEQIAAWPDDPMTVTAAITEARNVLRLPEEPPVPGSYPLEEDGSTLAQAYRMVLEAELEQIRRALY